MLPDTSLTGMEVRKFYYIGLTLPDLLLDAQMSAARGILNALHSVRVNVREWYLEVDASLEGPLSITDTTYDSIQKQISYGQNELPMNSNFPKVCQMVEYARSRNWNPKYKALIYGCYMHIIQDLLGSFVLLPSRFGYGYAIDSDSALAKPILGYAELYYEILSATHLNENDWSCIEQGLFRARKCDMGIPGGVADMGGYFDFYPYVQCYNRVGQMEWNQIRGWQQNDFPQIDSFVKAMNAVFEMNNLNRERLESYLHGYAILLFMFYGYSREDLTNVNMGGPMGHPEWQPQQIADFWDNIGDDFFQVRITTPWFLDLLFFLRFPIIYPFAWFAKQAIIGSFILWPSAKMPYSVLRNISPQDSWTTYLQTPTKLENLWNAIPESLKTDSITEEYQRAKSNLILWNDKAEVKKPNLRESYIEEESVSVAIDDLYHDALFGGVSYISPNSSEMVTYCISHKAGLLGGMFNPAEDRYYRQPGILKAGFRKSPYSIGSEIWTPITVGLQGDSLKINFFFDLVTFGPTRLRVMGKTENGSEIELKPYILDYEIGGRWQGNFNVNLLEAANSGAKSIHFKIYTKEINGNNYKEMFNSDYSNVYNSDTLINQDTLYKEWFTHGNPFRTNEQNPFAEPLHFWPYACSLKIISFFLSPPDKLTNEPDGRVPKVTLKWEDNSQAEHGYIIWRSVNQGSYSKLNHVNPNTITFDDTDIPSGSYNHRYFITAYYVISNDTFYSASTDTATISTGWVSRSSIPSGTAGKKVKAGGAITFDGSYIYALKGNDSREFYRIRPTSNIWQNNLASMPVDPYAPKNVKQGGALVALNGKIYALKGNSTREFYAFDTVNKTWSAKASIPWESSNKRKPVRRGAALTALNGLIYAFKGGNTREFWVYNPSNNTWTQKANITGNKKVSWGGSLVTIGAKIYALKGSNTKEFWVYNPTTNQWTRKADIPGSKKVRIGGSLTTCGNRIYAFKGSLSQEFYFYDTIANSWQSKDTIPRGTSNKRVGKGGSLTTVNGTIYGLKGNNSLEMWRYLPTYAGGDASGGSGGGGGLPFQNEDAVIVDGVEGWRPQWSSDGEWILYFAQDSMGCERIYKIQQDGSDMTCLTSDSADRICPLFSPNDSLIIYQKFDEATGTYRLCYIPANGGAETVLTDGQYDCEYPRWASDGDSIVFQKSDNTEYTQLYYTTISSGDEISLTSDDNDHEYPGFLLNSRDIVYQKQDQSGFYQIYNINTDSCVEIQLTSGNYEREYPYPSTDGNWAVYQRMDDDGFYHIYKVAMDGSGEVCLTEGDNDHENPVFSPDGQWVVFTFWTDSGTSQICKVPSEGGEITALTPDDGIRDYPKVSPDGQWIVYEKSDPDQGDGKGGYGIYKTRLNSTGIAGLTTPAYVFYLHPNQPNPFGLKTIIRYSLPAQEKASLIIYDIIGRRVRTLLNGMVKPGIYNAIWNGKDNNGKKVASGIYFCELRTEKQRMQRKIILSH